MLSKILVGVLAFAGTFLIQWYGNFTGRLPSKGVYLGVHFDSAIVRAVITQFEYLWVLIIVNMLFTLMFHVGLGSFKSYLSLAIIWLAMGPISALVYNSLVVKEKFHWVALVGIFFVIFGSVLVVAQKEIGALLR